MNYDQDNPFLERCHFCLGSWTECACTWDVNGGFKHDLFVIVEPNLDETLRFFVDPYEYYGRPYVEWLERKLGLRD